MINHKSSRQLDLKALYTRIGSMTTKNTSFIITHKRSIFSSHFYLSQRLETRNRHSPFIGDHDRPSHRLTRIEDDYYKGLTHVSTEIKDLRHIRFGLLTHFYLKHTVSRLAQTVNQSY